MANHEFTSPRVGTLASHLLSDPHTPPNALAVSGSALSQVRNRAPVDGRNVGLLDALLANTRNKLDGPETPERSYVIHPQ